LSTARTARCSVFADIPGETHAIGERVAASRREGVARAGPAFWGLGFRERNGERERERERQREREREREREIDRV